MPEAAAHVAADAVSLGLPPEERRRAFPSNELAVGNMEHPSEMPNEKPRKAPPKAPIKVIATRDGYYAPHRVPARCEFTVAQFSHLQSWMRCVDPEMQKLHEESMNERKKKNREAQLKLQQPADE